MGETTTCAIIGGGPAGMVLGLLLARAGVQVTLLEKHGDFLRDFRGDTVHPTTMRLLDELGLWERFAALPYSEVRTATLHSNGRAVTYIDFERLHQPYPYVAMVPQWDLLNLLAEAAQAEPSFTLRMKTEVTGLLREGGKVTGVRYQGAEGPGELRAELTVACDGRWSIARHEAGLKAREFPVNFDVWWFKLPREGDAEFSFLPRFSPGKGLGVIPREGYFQIAYLGPKGTDAQLRERGIEEFRRDVSELLPEATASVAALASMDEVKHLNVKVNRFPHVRWGHAGSGFGASQITRSSGRSGHDGRTEISRRAHRRDPLFNAVVGSVECERSSGRRPWRVARAQSGCAPTLPPIAAPRMRISSTLSLPQCCAGKRSRRRPRTRSRT